MTKEDPQELPFQDLRFDDTQQQQQQQNPFHVVLVDIEKAAKREIYCVEKPLEGDSDNLEFIALSYRWGELQEQMVNTKCGYTASITSFRLTDFYGLCDTMRNEPDLKSIQYVWVDAICVDQTNYERRKTAIHQMSNIYEKATYILAVPNLHELHLMNISQANRDVVHMLSDYHEYIYYFVQGNTEKLVQLDNKFLDDVGAPKDPILRRLLTKYIQNRMDNFLNMTCPYKIDAQLLVEQLHDISQIETLNNHHTFAFSGFGENETQTDRYAPFEDFLCCDRKNVPTDWHSRLGWRGNIDESGNPKLPWKDYTIRRNNAIRQIVKYFEDSILDWSSRVWVISEYHIAKKKNNLKFWFLSFGKQGMPFFEFDFVDSVLFSGNRNAELGIGKPPQIYLEFHKTVTRQLVTQCFFEKILNSKASKNEDRFYAIFPQSKYKDKVNQVADWKINTMLSVKLKLFEIMDTKDKLTLLFLAGYEHPAYTLFGPRSFMDHVLPTFATPIIRRSAFETYVSQYPLNFDFDNELTITLHHHVRDSRLYYFLQLIPKKYFVLRKLDDPFAVENYINPGKKKLCNEFQLNEVNVAIDIVCLTYFDENTMKSRARMLANFNCKLCLMGSFVENKWILTKPHRCFKEWDVDEINDNGTVFNIY